MALIVAIGLLLVLSIAVAAMIQFTSSSSRNASISHGGERAFSVAEAGLNEALATLGGTPDASLATALPAQAAPAQINVSDGVVDGTATYYGALSGGPASTRVWTVTATGTVPNPSGGAPISRTVSTQLRTRLVTAPSPNDDIWKYIFTDTPGCTVLSHNSNSVDWTARLYIKGNLCLSNNISLEGSPVQVGGTITFLGSNASVGLSAANPIAEAHIAGGCTGGSPNPHVCNPPADPVYATNLTTSLTEALQSPLLDVEELRKRYEYAQPGPMNFCNNTTGTKPSSSFFDNDGVFTGTASLSAINLTPASAYTCEFWESGTLLGRIAWAPGSPGTLSVLGKMYFDGNIVHGADALYQGRGIIHATGTIKFNINASLCVDAGCNATWDANQNLLMLVSGSNLTSPSGGGPFAIELDNLAEYQGILLTNGDYRQSNNAVTWASIVSNQAWIDNSTNTYAVPLSLPLDGAPSDVPSVIKADPIPGTYRG
jgi:hypothetical protein